VLDRAIADQARYPGGQRAGLGLALANKAWTPEQLNLVMKLRAMVARFEDTRDLRLMGGYRGGTDPALDRAIELVPRLYETMRQGPTDTPCADVFQEIARAFTPDPAATRRIDRPARAALRLRIGVLAPRGG
jgi:flagellum-specific ATP synthase